MKKKRRHDCPPASFSPQDYNSSEPHAAVMASWQHHVPRVLPPPARPRSPHLRSRHPPNGSRYTHPSRALFMFAPPSTTWVPVHHNKGGFYPVSVAALAERHAATLVFEGKPGTVKGSLPFIPQFGCCIFFSRCGSTRMILYFPS